MVRRVLLRARNAERLGRLGEELEATGVEVEMATDSERFSMQADIVICAASLASPSLLLGGSRPTQLYAMPVTPRICRQARRYLALKCSSEGWGR